METFVVSNGKPTIEKDPDAILDYTEDWAAWLAAADDPADTIDDAVVTATCDSASASVVSTAFDTSKVTAWISGGLAGEKVAVRYRVTTTGGRTDDRTVYLKIKER